MKVTDEQSRIWIRTKMSRIRNTAFYFLVLRRKKILKSFSFTFVKSRSSCAQYAMPLNEELRAVLNMLYPGYEKQQ